MNVTVREAQDEMEKGLGKESFNTIRKHVSKQIKPVKEEPPTQIVNTIGSVENPWEASSDEDQRSLDERYVDNYP